MELAASLLGVSLTKYCVSMKHIKDTYNLDFSQQVVKSLTLFHFMLSSSKFCKVIKKLYQNCLKGLHPTVYSLIFKYSLFL